jgi:hypothetical protein
MVVRGILAFIVALVLAALAAHPAAAQDQVVAPPGNSAVDEYTEVVPGAGGDRPTSGNSNSTPASPAEALGADNANQLEQLGPDGRAAAKVAAAGAPHKSVGGGTASDSPAENGRSIAAGDSGGRVGSIASALAGDGGGMGLLFPLLLVGTSVVAVALLGARRASRRR